MLNYGQEGLLFGMQYALLLELLTFPERGYQDTHSGLN